MRSSWPTFAYDEPLFAGGVRCHGGFAAGRYVSPRTLDRAPAIEAWQSRLRARASRSCTCRTSTSRRTIRTTRRPSSCCRKACAIRSRARSRSSRSSRASGRGSATCRCPTCARGGRGRLGHRPGAPRRRSVRGARARRGRLPRPGRPQADVGGRARPGARQARDPRRRAARDDDGRPRAASASGCSPSSRRGSRT